MWRGVAAGAQLALAPRYSIRDPCQPRPAHVLGELALELRPPGGLEAPTLIGGPRGRPVLAATASRTGVGFPGLAFGLEPMKQAKQQHRATSDHHCSGHKLSTDAQRDSKLLTHGQR
jgi:hypothetical protein